jgi:hypothetical protein
MKDDDLQARPTARRMRLARWAGFIALCAMPVLVVLIRSDALPKLSGWSASSSDHQAKRFDLPNAAISGADPTKTLTSRPAILLDSALNTRERVAALLKENVEVCGLSALEAAYFIASNGTTEASTASAVLASLAQKLIQVDEPRQKAKGLYMQARLVQLVSLESEAIAYHDCKGDIGCSGRSDEIQKQQRVAAAEPLISLALAGRDPDIYAAASYACNLATNGSCAAITSRWAAVDPDNAAAWAIVASAATTRDDVETRDHALRQAAAAGKYDLRFPSMAALTDVDFVKAQPILMQAQIGNHAFGLLASAALVQSSAMTNLCLRSSLDEARKALCGTLAEKMLAANNDVLGLSVAIAVGEKIGWNAARMQELRNEKSLVMGLLHEMMDVKNPYSCENLTKHNQWLQRTLAHGERGMAREKIAASGKSLAELAAHYRNVYPNALR